MTNNDSGPDSIPLFPREGQNGHIPPELSVRALANSRETGLDHSVVQDFLDVAEEWAKDILARPRHARRHSLRARRRHREIEVFLATFLSALAEIWRDNR